jgi:hypothetical protein
MVRSSLLLGTLSALAAAFLFASLPSIAAPNSPPAACASMFGSHNHKKKAEKTEAENVDFHVTGEVQHGKPFEQNIGHGLLFELVPPSNAPDAGWVIEIVPADQPASGNIEFSQIATPPYHTYNSRIIVPAYGRSAGDVVNLKERTFYFVDSVNDEHRAEEVVNAAYYPTDISDQERVHVVSEEGELHVSRGELHILKAHTSHAQTLGGAGQIDWIRFEIDIEFSPGITMANVLARVIRPQ